MKSRMMLDLEAKYGLTRSPNGARTLAETPARLGQNCPRHYPTAGEAGDPTMLDPLGAPLSIQEAAALIGISAWTLRQRYLPLGLPYFRTPPKGKLIFYQHQIVNWLLERQRKGGMTA